jgi:hypothetical protein
LRFEKNTKYEYAKTIAKNKEIKPIPGVTIKMLGKIGRSNENPTKP